MKEHKNEFFEFVKNSEAPPKMLNFFTQRDIQLSFHKGKILSKFISYMILGSIFTLTFCPQFGIGFVEGHGISHYLRIFGDWACAAFCGSLFLSSGMLMAYIGMKGEELWWAWRHYKYSLVLLPTSMWSLLMLMNFSFENTSESLVYHMIWLLTAFAAQAFWFTLRSKIYKHQKALQISI